MKNNKRNRGYYRYHRNRSIRRKKQILKAIWPYNKPEDIYGNKMGKLSKGKVHCSCKMCSMKTNSPFYGWKHRDKKILDAMAKEIKDYYNNLQ